MNKKGDVTLTLKEIWGLLKAAAMILVIVVVFVKIFFFINPVYARSTGSLERLQGVVNLLEEGESRPFLLDSERGVWLFGFNKDKNSIKYRRTDYIVFQRTYEQSKPRGCDIGNACLCLCSDDCRKFANCKVFDDIDFFVVTDISDQLNGGISYEFDGEQGNYLAMPGQGIINLEIWRDDNIIYIGQNVVGKGDARQEFESFVTFAKNIGIRHPGTCKLVFEINITKLTQDYYLVVYADGNVKLFSGEGEQARELAAEKIEKAPLLRTDFEDNEIDQIFEDYDTLQITDFRIPQTAVPSGADVHGTQKEITLDKIFLIQRDGKWLWTTNELDSVEECEQ